MSLLGAVAYLAHPRVDLTVFIVALPRRNHNPEVQHARKLHKLLRWLQRKPNKLTCKRMPGGGSHLRGISDAAFKREAEDGYSLRGAIFLRAAGNNMTTKVVVHVLDWACKSQRHVTHILPFYVS